MDSRIDLIGTLRNYCENNNIYFIPGSQAYQNAVADRKLYSAYENILLTSFTISPSFNINSSIDTYTYNGLISLGRKREESTVASLDETFEQKYDRRLLELTDMLLSILTELQCQFDITIDSCRISYDINKLDLNADFVTAELQISL